MARAARRVSLFRHTSVTVALALIVFQFVVLGVSAYYVAYPMARRSADDLAALIVLSAKTWGELPPETRRDFEVELARRHNLWLFDTTSALPKYDGYHPYLALLQKALARRAGQPVRIKVTHWEKTWFWVDLSFGGQPIRVGFPEDILGMRLPLALLLVLAATIVLTLITALILARRITHPLQAMAQAARHVGMGQAPAFLPEKGPEELAALARTFNQMAQEVQALLANRTTLMAGISHDLRTPLARMRIGLEMLGAGADEKAVARLTRDVEEMNRLIGEFLTFSRGLEKEAAHDTDLHALLRELADKAALEGGTVRVAVAAGAEAAGPQACVRQVGPLALRRILSNLIGNAVRYGAGHPVELECACGAGETVIRVLDRGPGIPPEEVENVFRPFYRLESSRSSATGGSGLGLAIAQQLAHANGWQIDLLPREGGGTEARLTLPGA